MQITQINTWTCRQLISNIENLKLAHERTFEEGIAYAIETFFNLRLREKLVTNFRLHFLQSIFEKRIKRVNIIDHPDQINENEAWFFVKEDPISLSFFHGILEKIKPEGTALFLFERDNICMYNQMQYILSKYPLLTLLPIWQMTSSFYIIPVHHIGAKFSSKQLEQQLQSM